MQFETLTKKNQEFVKIATHQLIKDGKSDADIKAILEEVLPLIEENQKKGIPARTLLGAPTLWAASFTEQGHGKPDVKAKNTNPWLMWLDTTLLFLGAFGLLSAVVQSFSKEATTYGWLTLLILATSGGLSMYGIYYFVYRPAGQGKPLHWFKSIAILILITTIWIVLFTLASILIPTSINPPLPLLALALIGAAAFAVRYYLQKKYNIANAMTIERQ